jgi:hypothetical protein
VVATLQHTSSKITSSTNVQSQLLPPSHRANGAFEGAGVETGNMKLKISSILKNGREWSPAPYHGDDQDGGAAGHPLQLGASTRQQYQQPLYSQEGPVKHSHSIAAEWDGDDGSSQPLQTPSFVDCMRFFVEG